MYPLSKATDNLRRAFALVNDIAVQNEVRYVGSEHFVYAFLQMPQCVAYQALISRGITKAQYEELFLRKLDKNSKYDGLTQRTQKMYDRAVLLAEEEGLSAGTAHMLYAILEIPDSWATRILHLLTDVEELRETVRDKIKDCAREELARKNYAPFERENLSFDDMFQKEQCKEERKDNSSSTIERGNAYSSSAKKRETVEKLSAYGTDMTERARKGKMDPVIGRKKEIEKVIQVLSRRLKRMNTLYHVGKRNSILYSLFLIN